MDLNKPHATLCYPSFQFINFSNHVEAVSRAAIEQLPASANPRVIFTTVLALMAVAIEPSLQTLLFMLLHPPQSS